MLKGNAHFRVKMSLVSSPARLLSCSDQNVEVSKIDQTCGLGFRYKAGQGRISPSDHSPNGRVVRWAVRGTSNRECMNWVFTCHKTLIVGRN